ncbi:hypothetical protein Msil_3059 [Methylocella silvestris BL2]|uniref:Major tropism determinant N-terminal domain-containing protein n=1 Tax=Methylocella silvestris (strain DSM 15510 / CIP 108128 / LMG 27833 / NCIMB 13906 / BL2) TaxID=395965 RepID=B8EKU1_METSB|nr:hypothetical protein [Methylocella silvestris]ACK51969.1 hypothetical protein Msil_3059 [Methylocella silvestris BL2]
MSVQVKSRRETASFLSTYVGATGELLVDTTSWRVQVHDGATPGGHSLALLSDPPNLQNVSGLGVNASYDSINRVVVKSPALLFDHIGAGVQFKVNKNGVSDTASLLYQTNYSGRAEAGLCGDDQFHLKTSADGSAWVDGIVQRTLSVQNSGDLNDASSGPGLDHDHSLSFVIPANFLINGRALRLTAAMRLTTGSAPPTLVTKVKLGATAICAVGAVTPVASVTNQQLALSWIFQAIGAPSASAPLECAVLAAAANVSASSFQNTIAMPVTIATNAALPLKISTLWGSAGTGVNQIKLSQLVVEALN